MEGRVLDVVMRVTNGMVVLRVGPDALATVTQELTPAQAETLSHMLHVAAEKAKGGR